MLKFDGIPEVAWDRQKWSTQIQAFPKIETQSTSLEGYKLQEPEQCLIFTDPRPCGQLEEVTSAKVLSRFSALWNQSEQEILKFAEEFGPLTSLRRPSDMEGLSRCEPLTFWQAEAARVTLSRSLTALSLIPAGAHAEQTVPNGQFLKRKGIVVKWAEYHEFHRKCVQDAHEYLALRTSLTAFQKVSAVAHKQDRANYHEFQLGQGQREASWAMHVWFREILSSALLGCRIGLTPNEAAGPPGLQLQGWNLVGQIYCWLLEESLGDTIRTKKCERCEKVLGTPSSMGGSITTRKRFCSEKCQRFMKRRETKLPPSPPK